MNEQARKYIEEKILYYGWISENDWVEQIKNYNAVQQPDLLKWLIQRRLIGEEQAGFLRPGLAAFNASPPKEAQTSFEEAIAQPPEMIDTLAGHINSESTPTVDIMQSPTASWEANPQSQSPTMAGAEIPPTSGPDAVTMTGNQKIATPAGTPQDNSGAATINVDFSKDAAKTPTPVTVSPMTALPPSSKSPPPTSKGFDPAKKRFGPYEILEKLGEGGMGQVYKARHVFLDKLVALKVLAKHLSTNPQFIERFFREAKACGKMDHPNVVRSLDAGEIDGVSYLALEFVAGKPLSKLVRDGDVTQSQAVKYLIGILKALDYAEGLRLVHRDIKPDNIMISDEKKVAKLLDMGLTKEVGDTSMTKAGQILGTPDYISPEQARGDINIDIRADIYSLGATFYHVLTGQKPFPGGGSVLVLLNQHISTPLTPLQQIKPLLDKNICAIIERMMAKDKNDRYLHPKDIIQEIENLIKQSSEIAPPTTSLTPIPVSPPDLASSGATPVIPGKGRNPNAPVRPSNTEPQTTGTIISAEVNPANKETKIQEPKKHAPRSSSAKSGALKPTLDPSQATPFKTTPENKKEVVLPVPPKSSSVLPKLLMMMMFIAIVGGVVFFVFFYNKPK